MKKRIFIPLLLVLTLFAPVGLKAQEDDAALQKKHERLQSLISLRIKEEAGLSDDQAAKVTAILSKYRQKRWDLRKKMMSYRQELKAAVDSNDSKRTSQVISDMHKTRGEMEKLDDAQFGEIKDILSPAQQGKFILVMEDIRREVMQFRRGGDKRNPSP